MFLFCLVFAMSVRVCLSFSPAKVSKIRQSQPLVGQDAVYMCFVVTCWDRADLLALVCGVYCEFVTFPLVSWVRCGT